MEQIAEVLKAAQSGLRDPQQPLGVFLLVGPSGVGKTETALAVAEHLFGGEQAMISVNIERIPGKAHRQQAGGCARRVRWLWRRRDADRGGAQAPILGGAA